MLLLLHVCMVHLQHAYACEGLGEGHPCVLGCMWGSGNKVECQIASFTLSEDVHLLTAVYVRLAGSQGSEALLVSHLAIGFWRS